MNEQTYQDRPTLEAWNALAESVPKIAAGTYTGDGVAPRTIDIGFTPKFLVITAAQRPSSEYNYSDQLIGAFGSPDMLCGVPRNSNTIIVYDCQSAENGFTLTNTTLGRLNGNGIVYHYFAVG